jgi:hypothetical protein
MPSVRLIKHEAVPKCGSYEVRFLAGKPSRYFYWEDLPSRRLRPEQMTDEEALEQADRQVFAKFKHLLRKAAARLSETICVTIGEILRAFTPTECATGYAQS